MPAASASSGWCAGPRPRSGAGIGPRQLVAFHPDVRVDVVDPDAALLEVARACFGLAAGPRLRVEVADGRAVLERDDGRSWDLIVIDAFGAGFYPASLASVEAFRLARGRLRPGGVLAVNLAGRFAGARLPTVYAAAEPRLPHLAAIAALRQEPPAPTAPPLHDGDAGAEIAIA